jgi:hypothetical protein
MRKLLTVFLLATIAAFASDARAVTVDVVGGTTNSATGSGLAKGNVYRIDTTVNLLNFEALLHFSGTETLEFYVFKNSSEFGNYSLVTSTSFAATGTGVDTFYSSGILNTALNSGSWYNLAVSWSGMANTYYFNVGDSQATSFGAQVHGFATGTHPLGATIFDNANDQAIYFQRVTTGVPEPSSLMLAALGFVATAVWGWRRRRRAA